jgi:hypothetical protein
MKLSYPDSQALVLGFLHALLYAKLSDDLQKKLGEENARQRIEGPLFFGAIHTRGKGQIYTRYRVAKVRVCANQSNRIHDYTLTLFLTQDVYVDDATYSSMWEVMKVIKTNEAGRIAHQIRFCLISKFAPKDIPVLVSHGWTLSDWDVKSFTLKASTVTQELALWDANWEAKQERRRMSRQGRRESQE